MKRILVLSSTVWRTLCEFGGLCPPQTDPWSAHNGEVNEARSPKGAARKCFLGLLSSPKEENEHVFSLFCHPKWQGNLWWSHTFFSCLFSLYRIQVDGWNAALFLYIQFVVKPQFSVESVWAECLALVQSCWWNTTNRLQHPKQGRLESNQQFFYACTINLIFGPLFLQCISSRSFFNAVSVHCMLDFKGKGLCFAVTVRDKLWSVLDVLSQFIGVSPRTVNSGNGVRG